MANELEHFTKQTVARFMEKVVQCGHRQTRADQLASWMLEGFGAVPIVDEQQKLIGLVSEYDLLFALERGRRLRDLTASEVMAPNPYSIRPETDLGTLIHVLRASHLIRVPVVDGTGKLIGIVARRDILKAYGDHEDNKMLK
jgi:CBS-domain-containing membrane protein